MREAVRLIIKRLTEGPPTDSHEQPGTVLDSSGTAIRVQTEGSTSVVLEQVQPAGKRLMTAGEFQNGYRVAVGDRFRTAAEPAAEMNN